jgi:hypothetical protein
MASPFDIKQFRESQTEPYYRQMPLSRLAKEAYQYIPEARSQYPTPDEWIASQPWKKDVDEENAYLQQEAQRRQAEQNREQMGDFHRGVRRGLHQTAGLMGGAVGLAGSALQDMTGGAVGQGIQDWGMGAYKSRMEKAAMYPGTTFREVWEGGSAIDWAQGVVGEQLPVLFTGGLSGFVGKKIAQKGITEGMKTWARDKIVKEGLKSEMKAVAAGEVGKGLTQQQIRGIAQQRLSEQLQNKAEGALAQIISNRVGQTGFKAGVMAGMTGLEGGGMYAEVLEDHKIDNPWSALVLGAAAGSIEILGGNFMIIEKALRGALGDTIKGALKSGRKDAALAAMTTLFKNAGTEFAQEAAQEALAITNVAVNDPKFEVNHPDNLWRIFEGAMAGAVMGIAGGSRSAAYAYTKTREGAVDPRETVSQEEQLGAKYLSQDPIDKLSAQFDEFVTTGAMPKIDSGFFEAGQLGKMEDQMSAPRPDQTRPAFPPRISPTAPVAPPAPPAAPLPPMFEGKKPLKTADARQARIEELAPQEDLPLETITRMRRARNQAEIRKAFATETAEDVAKASPEVSKAVLEIAQENPDAAPLDGEMWGDYDERMADVMDEVQREKFERAVNSSLDQMTSAPEGKDVADQDYFDARAKEREDRRAAAKTEISSLPKKAQDRVEVLMSAIAGEGPVAKTNADRNRLQLLTDRLGAAFEKSRKQGAATVTRDNVMDVMAESIDAGRKLKEADAPLRGVKLSPAERTALEAKAAIWKRFNAPVAKPNQTKDEAFGERFAGLRKDIIAQVEKNRAVAAAKAKTEAPPDALGPGAATPPTSPAPPIAPTPTTTPQGEMTDGLQTEGKTQTETAVTPEARRGPLRPRKAPPEGGYPVREPVTGAQKTDPAAEQRMAVVARALRKRTAAQRRPDTQTQETTDTHAAVAKRLGDKYKDLYKLSEIDTDDPFFYDVEEYRATPESVKSFIEKAKDKPAAAENVRKVVADMLGELEETHKYEGHKDGKFIEDYIDSVLSAIPGGRGTADGPKTGTDQTVKAEGIPDDPGVKIVPKAPPVNAPTPPPTAATPTAKPTPAAVLAKAREMQGDQPQGFVSIPDLRKEFPGVSKQDFDDLILSMGNKEITLQKNVFPGGEKAERLEKLVKYGDDYFEGFGFKDDAAATAAPAAKKPVPDLSEYDPEKQIKGFKEWAKEDAAQREISRLSMAKNEYLKALDSGDPAKIKFAKNILKSAFDTIDQKVGTAQAGKIEKDFNRFYGLLSESDPQRAFTDKIYNWLSKKSETPPDSVHGRAVGNQPVNIFNTAQIRRGQKIANETQRTIAFVETFVEDTGAPLGGFFIEVPVNVDVSRGTMGRTVLEGYVAEGRFSHPKFRGSIKKTIQPTTAAPRAKAKAAPKAKEKVKTKAAVKTRPKESPKAAVPKAKPGEVSPNAFKAAHDKLVRGLIPVYIKDLRKELGWSREDFDNMMDRLLRTIHPETGKKLLTPHGNSSHTASTFTDDDRKNSYKSTDDQFYVAVQWNGPALPETASAKTTETIKSDILKSAAATPKTGWFGDNKVFISHAFDQFKKDNPDSGMDLAGFKKFLVDNLRGQLSRADLVSAMDPKDVAASEVEYLNATFHFIRPDVDKQYVRPKARPAEPAPAAKGETTPVSPKTEIKIEPGETKKDIVVTTKMSAKKEDGIAPKEQKKYLLAEIETAIKDIDPITKIAAADFLNRNPAPQDSRDVAAIDAWFDEYRAVVGTVTIEVPGDGVFTIPRTRADLKNFEAAAKKFPVGPLAKPVGETPVTVSKGKNRLSGFDGYYYNEYAPRKDVILQSSGIKDRREMSPDGWVTDGLVLVKVPDGYKDVGQEPRVLKSAEDKDALEKFTRTLDTIKSAEKDGNLLPARVYGEFYYNTAGSPGVQPQAHIGEVGPDGTHVLVDAKRLDGVLTAYPKAKIFVTDNGLMVVFKHKGEVVGALSPFGTHPTTIHGIPEYAQQRFEELYGYAIPKEPKDQKYQTTLTTEGSGITKADVKRIFNKRAYEVKQNKDGTFRILVGDKWLTLRQVKSIALDEAAFVLEYKRKPVPGETVLAAFTKQSQTITFTKDAKGSFTLGHEFFHFLRENGFVDDSQYGALQRRVSREMGVAYAEVTENQIADWVGKNLTDRAIAREKGLVRRVLQTLKDVMNGFTELFNSQLSGRKVLRDIESGRIAREPKGGAKGFNQFAVKLGTPLKDAVELTRRNPAWRKWMEGARIRKPLFHATKKDFPEFDPQMRGADTRIWLSPSKKFAFSIFGTDDQRSGKYQANNVLWTNIKNPFDARKPEHRKIYAEVLKEINPDTPQGMIDRLNDQLGGNDNWMAYHDPAIAMAIEGKGFDSIIETEAGVENIAVFDGAQVKSVFNNGAFSPADRRIQYSAADEAGASATEIADAMKEWAEKGTDSKYFQRWFGDSQVVDAKGKPLVVKHETLESVDALHPGGLDDDALYDATGLMPPNKTRKSYFKDFAYRSGPVIYFKDLNEKGYGSGKDMRTSGEHSIKSPKEYPVYLSLKNPSVIKSHYIRKIIRDQITKDDSPLAAEFPYTISTQQKNELIKRGVDGIILEIPGEAKEYIAFHANQIKSATGNRGTFSPDSDSIRYSTIIDQGLVDRLESGKKIKVFRAMQTIDGKLYPPMSAKINGILRQPTEIGKWEQADESPELAIGGKFKLDKANKSSIAARYNPYFHTSRSPLNDQFSSAHKRDNLVTVEVEVPASELTSGYKAEGAKDAVGEMKWHSGPVSSKLPQNKKRSVILSRYAKVLRIVPDSEVAKRIAKMLEGENISIPGNTVTPSLKKELIKNGVPVTEQKTAAATTTIAPGVKYQTNINSVSDAIRVAPEQLGFFQSIQDKYEKLKAWSKDPEQRERFWAEFTRKNLDQLDPIKRKIGLKSYQYHKALTGAVGVMDIALRHGQLIMTEKDGYKYLTMKDMSVRGKGLDDFERRVEKDIDGGLRTLLYWGAAKRAEKLEERGKEKVLTQDIRDQIYTAVLGADKTQWAAKQKVFEKHFKEFESWNNSFLDIAQASGLISAAERANWHKDFYVPFYRIIKTPTLLEEFIRSPKASRKSIAAKIKTLKGGESQIEDPLLSVLGNWTHFTKSALQNIARREAFEQDRATMAHLYKVLDKKDGDPDATTNLREVYRVTKKTQRADGSMKHEPTDLYFYKHLRTDQDGNLIERMPGDTRPWPKGAKKILLSPKEIEQVMSFSQAEKADPKDQKVYFVAKDPGLGQALMGPVVVAPGSFFMKAFRGSKRLLTYSATFGGAFKVANWMRDGVHTWLIDPEFKLTDMVTGLKKAYTESDEYVALMSSGFGFGTSYVRSDDPAALNKYLTSRLGRPDKSYVLHNLSRALAFWERLGHASEMAARTMVFERNFAKTDNVMIAGYKARDLLDFTQSGAGTAMQFMIQTVPFLNARIQGGMKLYKTGMEKTTRANMARRGAIITGASLALFAAFGDDERYKALQDWEKWTYWNFWIGDEHIRLPKPFELGIVFGTIPETLAQVFTGDERGEYFMKMLKHSITETMSVSWPQIINPAKDVFYNRSSFTGSPILGAGPSGLSEHLQAKPWSSRFLKEMAEQAAKAGIEFSPVKTEYLINGYFSTIGQMVLDGADIVTELLGDYPDKPAKQIKDYPVVGRFVRGSGEARRTKYEDRYYDMMKQLDQTARDIKHYEFVGNWKKAQALTIDRWRQQNIAPEARKVGKEARELDKQIQQLWDDPRPSGKDKDNRINDLLRRKHQIYKQFYTNYADTLADV